MIFCLPFSIISTRFLRCGKMAHPIRMAICCTILMPVWRACHDFLLRQTALRKGSSDGMPSAEATTANALQMLRVKHSNVMLPDIAEIKDTHFINQHITKCTLHMTMCPYKTPVNYPSNYDYIKKSLLH